jgi:uroporphyrinogen III methyltransferase/synthase
MADTVAQVYFVGVGPGNPGLLTLRAAECLSRAEVVIHDRLVPARILDYAPATAARICVADLPGPHPEKGAQIHTLMIQTARQGKCVVRLKGGDPLLFARGGEEVEAMAEAGIPYEIVPGVTAGLAAGAFAGIPLSHRLLSSAVALVTGHEDPAKPDSNLDWAALARFPGTLAIYMGMARLAQIVSTLLQHGMPPQTPAAVVEWGSVGDQRTIEAPLASLPAAVHAAGLKPPSIIIIGPVVSLRSKLAWFEKRPLFGKNIIVTRPRRQAGEFARRLEELGAAIHLMPVVEIRDPVDWAPVDQAFARMSDYRWLIFTSANGVHALIRRLRETGRDLRTLGSVQLAAIGPSTADALRSYHLNPDVMPGSFRSENLADALKERVFGQRVLLVRADRGREVLREQLSQVAFVEQIAAYSQGDVALESRTLDLLRNGQIHYVTLTSSNIARAFLRALDDECRARIVAGQTRVVTISPVTSETVREMGMPVTAEAAQYTSEGICDVLVKLATGALD